MRNRDINIDLVVSKLREDIERFNAMDQGENTDLAFMNIFKGSISYLKKLFPGLNEIDTIRLLELAIGLYNSKKSEKVEIVLTAPNSFRLKARKTYAVMDEIIKNAKKSIMLTGYSISEYVDDKLELLIQKSKTGVYVNLFVNDIKHKEEQLQKILMYRGKFLNIYNYCGKTDDKMAALHAKVIVTDKQKALITSSNLSYHGIEGNIEMGVLIESENKCKDIEEIFFCLLRQKVFEKVIDTGLS